MSFKKIGSGWEPKAGKTYRSCCFNPEALLQAIEKAKVDGKKDVWIMIFDNKNKKEGTNQPDFEFMVIQDEPDKVPAPSKWEPKDADVFNQKVEAIYESDIPF